MKFYTTISLIVLLAIASSCGGDTEPAANQPNTNVKPAANENTAPANTMDGVRRPDAPTSNDAPTIAPVVHAFYEALKKKDDAALRAVLSRSVLQSLEADMKEENRTDLAVFVAEFETLPAGQVEIRNEQITGDKAIAEIQGGTYVKWTQMGFIKEDGRWKWSGDSPDIDRVK